MAVACLKRSFPLNQRISLQENIRFQVLRCLYEAQDASQSTLVNDLGTSVGGSTSFCFQALIDKSQGKHKMGYVFLRTPAGTAATLTAHFLKRKLEEHEALHAEIDQLKAELPHIVKVVS